MGRDRFFNCLCQFKCSCTNSNVQANWASGGLVGTGEIAKLARHRLARNEPIELSWLVEIIRLIRLS